MLLLISDVIFRQSSPSKNLRSYYYRKEIKLWEVKLFSRNNSHSTYEKEKKWTLTKNTFLPGKNKLFWEWRKKCLLLSIFWVNPFRVWITDFSSSQEKNSIANYDCLFWGIYVFLASKQNYRDAFVVKQI